MTLEDSHCAKFCLAPHPLDKSPPRTPDNVKKWRKSNFLDPGKKLSHPAMIGDLEKRGYSEERILFGCAKKNGEVDDHVEDLWVQHDCDEYHSVKKGLLEASYNSTPLGRSQNRGHKLPGFMLDSDYRHGVTSSKAEQDAKQLIYAKSTGSDRLDNKVNTENENNYIISHGSYKPGQQRTRNYNWPVNPKSTTFGIKNDDWTGKGRSIGVAQALQMKGECNDDCAEEDKVAENGKVHSPDKVFGKSTSTSQADSSAAECLGHTKEANDFDRYVDQSDDMDDLGKSMTPGFRNASTVRCFGCPSIRTDIPQYDRNSVADTQNYGDDVSAGYLLRPSLFSAVGLDEDEFCKPRSKEYLQKLFDSCGMNIHHDTFESTFSTISDENDRASIESFRSVYNKLSFHKSNLT